MFTLVSEVASCVEMYKYRKATTLLMMMLMARWEVNSICLIHKCGHPVATSIGVDTANLSSNDATLRSGIDIVCVGIYYRR